MTSIRVVKIIFGRNGARVGVLATWEMTVERRYCAEGATVEMASAGGKKREREREVKGKYFPTGVLSLQHSIPANVPWV